MPMPELVIQEGVSRAWKFAQEHTREIVGHLMRYWPIDRQEGYRDLITNETPMIVFQNPGVRPRLPSFTISLLSENETPEGQYVGMEGYDYRELPYPAVAPEDFYPQEPFQGLVYGDKDCVLPISVDGPHVIGAEDSHHPLARKNLHIQRNFGSELREQLGYPARLYDKNQQRLSFQSVGDQSTVGITVTTGSFEKTFVYYRILRWVLRRFTGWFQANGIQNPTFSGMDLQPAEDLLPTTSASPVFRRQLTMSFFHEDTAVQLDSILKGWILSIDMATQRPDGRLDFTPLYEIRSPSLSDED